MWNMFDIFIMQYKIKLTRLQKYLLMALYTLLIAGSMKYNYALIGHRILFYTVEPWMVIFEAIQQILLLPVICSAIMRIPEE
jgi:hypothetical protein